MEKITIEYIDWLFSNKDSIPTKDDFSFLFINTNSNLLANDSLYNTVSPAMRLDMRYGYFLEEWIDKSWKDLTLLSKLNGRKLGKYILYTNDDANNADLIWDILGNRLNDNLMEHLQKNTKKEIEVKLFNGKYRLYQEGKEIDSIEEKIVNGYANRHKIYPDDVAKYLFSKF